MIKENKITKYFVYAIGEIVLVVIGILIALQVNEWNQHRKERQRELGYLKEIKTNLISDSLSLKVVIDFNKDKIETCDSIIGLFNIKYSKLEHARFISTNFFKISSFELFKMNSTAFDNMKSADNLGIISSDLLRQKLSEYYNYNVESSQEKLVLQTRKLTDYLNKNIVTKELIEQYMGFETKFPSETTVDIQSDPTLFTAFGENNALMINQNAIASERLDKIKELQSIIELEMRKFSE